MTEAQVQDLPPEEVIRRLRARVEAGEKLTRDEVRLGLDAYRQGRASAASAGGKSKGPKAPARSATELLDLLKQSINPPTQGAPDGNKEA